MLRLLKIGGALITDKTKPYTEKIEAIKGVASAIRRAYGERFIIGHGGGSFPHTSAKKYGVKEGIKDDKTRFGVGVVHYDATWINQIFMSALHDEGVPSMSFHPSSFIFSEGRKPVKVLLDPILEALNRGIVPVVYGDVVIDSELGSTIFSTEMVLMTVADRVDEPVVIGMAELVDGVYTDDPLKNPDAEKIPLINRENYREVLSYVGGSHGIDVTGGMFHKLEKLLELAKRGITSYIFRGTPEKIEAFLKGTDPGGTRIEW